MSAARHAIIIAGIARSGTTFLHETLATHPSVIEAWIKEPQYLARAAMDRVPDSGPGDRSLARLAPRSVEEYEALWDPRVSLGRPLDSSTWTSYVPGAVNVAEEIWEHADYVLLLRDPFDRALSAWKHLRARGREKLTFESALAAEGDRVIAGWSPIWHYAKMSDPGLHLRNLESAVPPSRIHVLRFEDLVADPWGFTRELCRCLKLDPEPVRVAKTRNKSDGRARSMMGRLLWPTHPFVLRTVSRLPPGARVGARALRDAATRRRAVNATAPGLPPHFREMFEGFRQDYARLTASSAVRIPPRSDDVYGDR